MCHSYKHIFCLQAFESFVHVNVLQCTRACLLRLKFSHLQEHACSVGHADYVIHLHSLQEHLHPWRLRTSCRLRDGLDSLRIVKVQDAGCHNI